MVRAAMPADLVLLHGFTQTGRSWEPVRHALAARYRAVAPDLPGHGRFAARRPASFAACDAYLRVLGRGRITLAGYSMGGRIALHAALGLAAALRGLGTGVMPPLWERLGELAPPVELVVGERDEKFRAIAERMHSSLPDARLHVVAGAGHAVQLEAPEAIADLLRG